MLHRVGTHVVQTIPTQEREILRVGVAHELCRRVDGLEGEPLAQRSHANASPSSRDVPTSSSRRDINRTPVCPSRDAVSNVRLCRNVHACNRDVSSRPWWAIVAYEGRVARWVSGRMELCVDVYSA